MYDITLEEPDGKETGSGDDQDLGERPGEQIRGFHVPQQSPPEAQAVSQMWDVEVMLRRLPLQAREEGNKYVGDPEVGPEGQPGEQPGTSGEGQEQEVHRPHPQ